MRENPTIIPLSPSPLNNSPLPTAGQLTYVQRASSPETKSANYTSSACWTRSVQGHRTAGLPMKIWPELRFQQSDWGSRYLAEYIIYLEESENVYIWCVNYLPHARKSVNAERQRSYPINYLSIFVDCRDHTDNSSCSAKKNWCGVNRDTMPLIAINAVQ